MIKKKTLYGREKSMGVLRSARQVFKLSQGKLKIYVRYWGSEKRKAL